MLLELVYDPLSFRIPQRVLIDHEYEYPSVMSSTHSLSDLMPFRKSFYQDAVAGEGDPGGSRVTLAGRGTSQGGYLCNIHRRRVMVDTPPTNTRRLARDFSGRYHQQKV